jgi:translation initiation factor 2 subunit 1
MLYTKEGFPEVNEIVKCTVKKIYGNTTFVIVDEYDKEGVLTISEIAPGRIRNLRDYVMEGKEIICKVLRIDKKSGRIDVSLRRVPVPAMRQKLDEVKREDFSEKVYADAAEELKTTKDDLFERSYEQIFEQYDLVFDALYDIMQDNDKITLFSNFSENEQNALLKVINERIKPEEVHFKKEFSLKSLSSEGIEEIKEVIRQTLGSLSYDRIEVHYLAAGTFAVTITHEDMKSANKLYNQFEQALQKIAKQKDLELSIAEE